MLVVVGGVCQGEGDSKHPPLDCVFGDFCRITKVTPAERPPPAGGVLPSPLSDRSESGPSGASLLTEIIDFKKVVRYNVYQ